MQRFVEGMVRVWLAHVVVKALSLTQTAASVGILWVGAGVRVWQGDIRPVTWIKFQKILECNLDN